MLAAHLSKHRRLQRVFLGIIGLFVIFLVGISMYRSSTRKSLILAGGDSDNLKDLLSSLSSPVKNSSALHLQDFSRTQIKNGNRVWSVKAKDAKYYAEEGLAQLNDAEVILYREKNSTITLRSNGGKLFLQGDSLKKADMEGEVMVVIDESVTVKTDVASYDAQNSLITAPGPVQINGTGFDIHGVGLRAGVDNRVVDLLSDVHSTFQPHARVPKNLARIAQ